MQSFLSHINNVLFNEQTMSLPYFLYELYYNKYHNNISEIEYKSLLEYLLQCNLNKIMSTIPNDNVEDIMLFFTSNIYNNNTLFHNSEIIKHYINFLISTTINIVENEQYDRRIVESFIKIIKDVSRFIKSNILTVMKQKYGKLNENQLSEVLKKDITKQFGLIDKFNELINNNHNIPNKWKEVVNVFMHNTECYNLSKLIVCCNVILPRDECYFTLGALTKIVPEQYQ